MSLTEMEVHFDEMNKISASLAETAERLQKLVNGEGMSAILGVKSAWNSENTAVFINQGKKKADALCKIAVNLKVLSEEISERASQIYEVEKCNQLTAITRSYF